MTRTLYGKLVLVLFLLLVVLGSINIAQTLFVTRWHIQEVSQKLNQTLAGNIVNEALLIENDQINRPALESIFHNLMVINPSIEVYLIDPTGKIIAFSAPEGKVKRSSISLIPMLSFINNRAPLPILGDDPRDENRSKVFSAAKIEHQGALQGYLYVVLGGEAYDSVADMVQQSLVLRQGFGIAIIVIMLTLASGVALFKILTQRLRKLSLAIDTFKQNDFRVPVQNLGAHPRAPRDEIDQLTASFQQMADRLIQQIQQLEHADASRRELIANVSHDLRTPLASLQGYLETLILKHDDLDEQARRGYLETAVKRSQQLATLIAELFELAMLDTQGTALHFEPFSMAELLQDVAQKFRLEAEKKEIEITTVMAENLPYVSADIALIERVLDNLIENALKYTPQHGRIRLEVGYAEGHIFTRIEDTGRGIPKDDLVHIFERFYRVDKHRDHNPEGAGLGLAITKRILQLHNAPIDVQSELNAGTSFVFELQSAN